MVFLSKNWQDPEDGIETVILHWTVTPLEKEPHWIKANRVVMVAQPATYPVRRRCSFCVCPPFSLKAFFSLHPTERPTRFLVHSFFEVVQRGRAWSTETSSQEMHSVAITHSDPSSESTHAFLHYSLDELEHVYCTPMVLDGVAVQYQFLPTLPEGVLSAKDYQRRAKRSKLITRLPSPHIFRGHIWGPPDTRVLYAVYFGRQGGYNPFSENGFWLLKDGSFWEVKL